MRGPRQYLGNGYKSAERPMKIDPIRVSDEVVGSGGQ